MFQRKNKSNFIANIFKKNEVEKVLDSKIIIFSPLKGEVISLSEVNDEVFSTGLMGEGIAIKPENGKVYSPVNGKILFLFPSKHAIGIVSDNGVEILIHLGLDTVSLNGKCYKSYIKEGYRVNKGDLLVEFDIEEIKSKGYDVVSPIIITNSKELKQIEFLDNKFVDNEISIMNIFTI